jgi:tRNA-specific 2-thiouridylase
MLEKKKKVFVAMSGGVDSSVAALLLKKQGYQVTGVHFILAKSQAVQVRNICKKLSIPLKVWDFRRHFNKLIINDFISQFKNGLTPNPCVYCNRFIKFGLFYNKAKKSGADYIATGHYVKINKIDNQFSIIKGSDRNKDQSYFLWDINPEVLESCLFPLGDMTKEQVKIIARRNRLPVIKAESQEVCFIYGRINGYLKKFISLKIGLIKNILDKKTLGAHNGLFLFTLGQRSGLGLAGGPWYVVKKEIKNNCLSVTNNPNKLLKNEITVKQVNWLIKPPRFPCNLEVKPRYRHPGAKAKIFQSGPHYKVIFNKRQRALTPGQSTVFYYKDKLMGGGVIK